MGVLAPEQMTTTTSWAAVPAHELGVRDWSDFRAVHKAVMALFDTTLPGADHERRATSKILFRVDDTPRGRIVLVQSAAPADRPTPGTVSKDVTGRLTPPAGSMVRFRVAVNAVQRVPRSGADRPVPQADLADWLTGKLAPALDQVTVLTSVRTVHKPRRGGRVLQVDVVDGIAQVADHDALAELTSDGVGRGKAFGCGLLTVAPLR